MRWPTQMSTCQGHSQIFQAMIFDEALRLSKPCSPYVLKTFCRGPPRAPQSSWRYSHCCKVLIAWYGMAIALRDKRVSNREPVDSSMALSSLSVSHSIVVGLLCSVARKRSLVYNPRFNKVSMDFDLQQGSLTARPASLC
eukprot:18165-Pelagomonas_calceolata.AAC.1